MLKQKFHSLKYKLLRDKSLSLLLKNSKWVFVGNILITVIALVQGILLARYLGVVKYGILGLILTFATVVGQFFDSRSWETGVKYVTDFLSQDDEVKALSTIKLGYVIDITTSILSTLLLMLLATWLARTFIDDVDYTAAIQLYALTLLFNWNGGPQVLAKVFNRFDLLTHLNVGVTILRFLLIVLSLYVLKLGINGVLASYTVTAMVTAVIGIFIVRYFLNEHFTVRWHEAKIHHLKGHGRNIFRFLFSTNLTQLIKIVQHNGVILLLGFLSTPLHVGYFKLAQSYANKLLVLFNPILQSSYPQFSKLLNKNKVSEVRGLIKKTILLLGLVAIVFAGIALLTADVLIELTVGEDYLAAAPAFRILILAYALAGVLIWVGPLLLAAGKAEFRAVSVLVGSIVMIICSIILIPQMQSLGAAFGVLSLYIGWGLFSLIKVREVLRGDHPKGVHYDVEY